MSTGNRRWIRKQQQDGFVRRAKKQGFRSRAAYKLSDLDRRDKLLKPGMRVVELGAAPGGWSQYLHRRLGDSGVIVAVDRLPMPLIPGVIFICGDFTEAACRHRLAASLGGHKAGLVLSDMAPNITGIRDKDNANFSMLFGSILDFIDESLEPGGALLVKYFSGSAGDKLRVDCQRRFRQVRVRKPPASRKQSRENYLLAKGFLS